MYNCERDMAMFTVFAMHRYGHAIHYEQIKKPKNHADATSNGDAYGRPFDVCGECNVIYLQTCNICVTYLAARHNRRLSASTVSTTATATSHLHHQQHQHPPLCATTSPPSRTIPTLLPILLHLPPLPPLHLQAPLMAPPSLLLLLLLPYAGSPNPT